MVTVGFERKTEYIELIMKTVTARVVVVTLRGLEEEAAAVACSFNFSHRLICDFKGGSNSKRVIAE